MMFSGKNFSFELGKRTYLMGILNVTADSFYDGGRYNSPQEALEYAKQMLKEGADIIDIGAQSTNPSSHLISAEEELEILKQYLPLLYQETGAVISVDTFYPQVAEYALQNGVAIINDVSGAFNETMAGLVRQYNCGWVIMHNGGGNAKTVPDYKNGIVYEVKAFFEDMLAKCEGFGISKNQIMLDTGIGFGKTQEQNIELIKNINEIKIPHTALLTALSSKRIVKNTTGAEGEELVYGTISANALAIAGGTDFIRVHRVKENLLAAKMTDAVIRG